MLDRLRQLFGGDPTRKVAKALAAQLGADPSTSGPRSRLVGAWNGARCQVVLDGEADRMTASMSSACRDVTWEIRRTDADDDLTFISTHVAASAADAARFEDLPLTVRTHVVDVVEAGRGSIRLERGTLTMIACPAGLGRPNASDQAAIRLDVLADLNRAIGPSFRGGSS